MLLHPDLVPPDSLEGHSEQEINVWKTEYDVVSTLRAAGHEVRPLGVQDELKPIRDEIESWKPDVVFNLLEQFHGEAVYDQNVASYLELLRVPYTGCNPRGLMLARGKDLSKKLLTYHRIPVPAFAVFPMRRKVKRPARLGLPADRQEPERGRLLRHRAGLGGRQRREARRARHLHPRADRHRRRSPSSISRAASSMSACSATTGCACCRSGSSSSATWRRARGRIATEKVKHDLDYQERHGIMHGPAKDLSPRAARRASQQLAKRIYRTLELDGYARIDFRLSADGIPYFIEANPNPEIAQIEEFASAALHDGLEYPDLLHRILALGINRAGLAGIES